MDENTKFVELRKRHVELLYTPPAELSKSELEEPAKRLLADLSKAGDIVSNPNLRHRLELYAAYWCAFVFEQTGDYLDFRLRNGASVLRTLLEDRQKLKPRMPATEALDFIETYFAQTRDSLPLILCGKPEDMTSLVKGNFYHKLKEGLSDYLVFELYSFMPQSNFMTFANELSLYLTSQMNYPIKKFEEEVGIEDDFVTAWRAMCHRIARPPVVVLKIPLNSLRHGGGNTQADRKILSLLDAFLRYGRFLILDDPLRDEVFEKDEATSEYEVSIHYPD